MLKIFLSGVLMAVCCAHSEENTATYKKDNELERKRFLEEEEAERKSFAARVPILIEDLKTTKEGHRDFIIKNLAYSKDKRAIGPLTEVMLQSKVPEERSWAASNLSKFNDKLTIPAFKKALLDTIGARSNAAMALYELGEIDIALPELEKLALEGHTGVLGCFSRVDKNGKFIFDNNARPVFIKAINGNNENSRIVAALFLVEMGEKDIPFHVALEILHNSNKQANRERAISCLRKIGSNESATEISKLQNDPELHNIVIRSLKEMKRDDLIARQWRNIYTVPMC